MMEERLSLSIYLSIYLYYACPAAEATWSKRRGLALSSLLFSLLSANQPCMLEL
jgi:hypothetical protein